MLVFDRNRQTESKIKTDFWLAIIFILMISNTEYSLLVKKKQK